MLLVTGAPNHRPADWLSRLIIDPKIIYQAYPAAVGKKRLGGPIHADGRDLDPVDLTPVRSPSELDEAAARSRCVGGHSR
jgi:hypothetical protein